MYVDIINTLNDLSRCELIQFYSLSSSNIELNGLMIKI